jgi:membrane protease YdiL (CAAX protease family)
MRLRITAGLALGALAVALAGPPSWLPWGGWVRACLPAWWALPALAALLLTLAAACLPGRPADAGRGGELWPTRHHGATAAMGLGLLLLLELGLHLAVLAYLAHAWAPGGGDVLLPEAGGGRDLGLRFIVFCLLAPLAEELFFRGRLLPLLAARFGRWSGLWLSSLAFAIAHGSPLTSLVALPIGLLLGWIRLQHRDLGTCVLVHQAHNGLVLLAGPALVTSPVNAAILAGGGVLMLTIAAAHQQPRWRALPAGLALAAALACLLPPLLAAKDRWWAQGTARLVVRHRGGPEALLARFAAQERRGRLTATRRALLLERLPGDGGDAVRLLRVQLGAAADQAAALAALQLVEPPARLGEAVAAAGEADPGLIAPLAIIAPERLAALIGPDGWMRVLVQAGGQHRRHMLAGGERAWPGRFASLLLALPARQVGPLERRHLRLHYADAEALIAALDDERRRGWE